MIKVVQLLQAIQNMPQEKCNEMREFVLLVAERDELALEIIRRVESGELQPADALDDINFCIELNRHRQQCQR